MKKIKCVPMDLVLLSNPPQNKCKNCGQHWYTLHETPDCLMQTPKIKSEEKRDLNCCFNTIDEAIRIGKCHYVCRICKKDVSLLWFFYQQVVGETDLEEYNSS